jgi:transcriptional regulator
MVEAIVGFELSVERLEGKFKLSQNRRPEDVEGVAKALDAQGDSELAAMMRLRAVPPVESR